MKLCPYCGQEIDDNAEVCPYCGKEVGEAEAEAEENYENYKEEAYAADETNEQADEEEARREAVKQERAREAARAKKARARAKAPDEADDSDPLEPMKALAGRIIGKAGAFLAGKDESPKGWQVAAALIACVSSVLMIIAGFAGAVYCFAGAAASITLGFFILRKPKLNAVCMLIPLLILAVMCLSVSATYHSTMDFGAKATRVSTADYNAYLRLGEQAENVASRLLNRYGDELDHDPEAVLNVIFRVLVYSMSVLYALSLIGVLRRNDTFSYIMLGLSLLLGVYSLVMMFNSVSARIQLYNLGNVGFMAALFIFVLMSEKGRYARKSRTLHRLIRITPAPAKQYEDVHPYDKLGGALMVCFIGAFVLAGILALLGIYVIILMFVTTSAEGIGNFLYVVISLLHWLLLMGAAGLSVLLALKIKARDDSFLKHYHILAVACVCIAFVLLSTPVVPGWLMMLLTVVLASLFAGVTVYFVRSKRVFVYLDTNKYLMQSNLTRRFNPPQL